MSARFKSRPLLSVLIAAAVLMTALRSPSPTSARTATTPAPQRSMLRVGMWTLWHDRALTLTPPAMPAYTALSTCNSCAPVRLLQGTTIQADRNAITLTRGARVEHAERVWLSETSTLTAHGESVTLPFPVAISARNGVLAIAVTMPVETYVERVVASESGPADSAESLKALAIVVRTFALHEAHGHADYDVCDSTHCQLLHWGSNGNRQPAAHVAALATSSETLWFRGARALAYFNKDCGGHTASPTEIWPQAHAVAYLPSQPDRFCSAGGSKEWASEITRNELAAALAKAGVIAPGWQHLTIEKRGASGRAVTLRLDRNQISAETFILAVGQTLGWNKIPSTWFEVSERGDRFLFHGRGWGHGVGLCQKGSAAMAAQGRSAQQILEQYFPGAQAADEATGRAWKSFASAGFTLESLSDADAAFIADMNRARAQASERSGLQGSSSITVRAFPSTTAFRDATLSPGWVAAFTEGNWIATQPLSTLAARKLLDDTLLHEFLHALVEAQAGSATPLWLREGLVETWSQHNAEPAAPPALRLEMLDAVLAHATTEADSEAAHRAAGWYAAQILKRYGREQVIAWIRFGPPSNALAFLSQR